MIHTEALLLAQIWHVIDYVVTMLYKGPPPKTVVAFQGEERQIRLDRGVPLINL
jgi:hypothetical protein